LIEHYRTRPPGGQQVSLTETGVKVTYVPTGMIAICTSERSQLHNRRIAMAMIEYGLIEGGYLK